MKEQKLQIPAGYDIDFYEWTQQTGELIRQGRFQEIDRQHVAEEITDMGKRDYREVRSRLTVLVMHLLKWQAQGDRRASSWKATIVEQRIQLKLVLQDSPSLRNIPSAELPLIYLDAVEIAMEETGLQAGSFPASCPYTAQEVMDPGFFPEGPLPGAAHD